jgi:sulfide:quinone oxidoreductase
VATTLVAPEPEFVYRPMTVREPFGYSLAKRYSLEELASDIGVELVQDSFKWLDPVVSVVHTEGGRELGYDALLPRARRTAVLPLRARADDR